MPLHVSASAPNLAPHVHASAAAYAHSERVARVVPPLALVPLHQLEKQKQQRQESEQLLHRDEELLKLRKKNKSAARRRRQLQSTRSSELVDRQHNELHHEEQKRLGERFLSMMALLAKLRSMDLDSDAVIAQRVPSAGDLHRGRFSPQKKTQPSILQQLVDNNKQKQKQRQNEISGNSDQSPHRKPEPVVNVATAPLREHLTFEISMLLPAPMDTRQSALQSPIHRQQREKRPRRKPKRRKKRPTGSTRGPDGKRTWQTSHATWAPHSSADYAQVRSDQRLARTGSSKLVAKFAALREAVGGGGGGGDGGGLYMYAFEKEESSREPPTGQDATQDEDNFGGYQEWEEGDQDAEVEDDEEGEEGKDEAKDDSLEDDEDVNDDDDQVEDDDDHADESDADDEQGDTLPELATAVVLSTTRSTNSNTDINCNTASTHSLRPHRQPVGSAVLHRPMQSHPAAWISPELRTWLIQTGLFRTKTTTTPT